MKRARTRGDSRDLLELTVGFHTRISKQAMRMLQDMAREQFVKPATLGRTILYRGLGIIKPARPRRR